MNGLLLDGGTEIAGVLKELVEDVWEVVVSWGMPELVVLELRRGLPEDEAEEFAEEDPVLFWDSELELDDALEVIVEDA